MIIDFSNLPKYKIVPSNYSDYINSNLIQYQSVFNAPFAIGIFPCSMYRFGSCSLTKDNNLDYFHQDFHHCKDYALSRTYDIFYKLKKYTDIYMCLLAPKCLLEKSLNVVNKFELEVLKLNKFTELFALENYQNIYGFKIARRWFRSPQSFSLLLLLIKLSEYFKQEKTLHENLENMYKLFHFPAYLQNSICSQFINSYYIIQEMITRGYENFFESSKNFNNNWSISKISSMSESYGFVAFSRQILYRLYQCVSKNTINLNTYAGIKKEIFDELFLTPSPNYKFQDHILQEYLNNYKEAIKNYLVA